MSTLAFLRLRRENDRIAKSGQFQIPASETISALTPIPVQRQTGYRVADNLAALDTVSCILSRTEAHITALNFANAMFPGGGYLLGGNAQEESLCRASLLYHTLRTQKRFYRRNRLHLLPDYTDTLIYSPAVPVLRTADGTRLTKPVFCDFITVPAVNRSFAKFIMTQRHIDTCMERRIALLLGLAVSHTPEVLILGAFGCGMFGNRQQTVLPMFERAINRYVPDSVQVVFAIPN